MALILQVDSKTRVHIQINLEELIDKIIKYDGVIDDETNDTCWINYNVLEEVISKFNKDSYILVRNGESFQKKLIINAPKVFTFFRRKESSSGM